MVINDAMKLQQLRYLVEVARRGLNVSEAAEALFTSQPGVSKQIGCSRTNWASDLRAQRQASCRRHGPGRIVLEIARRILSETENMKRVGEEFAGREQRSCPLPRPTPRRATPCRRWSRTSSIAILTSACLCIRAARRRSPNGLIKGEADIAIATEALDQYSQLVMLPCYQWAHCVVAPIGHPLLAETSLTLANSRCRPLITYDPAFAGRSRINKAFAQAQLAPNIVLAAIDADVIKTYVDLGLGLASSPAWPTMPSATPACRRSKPATCSARTPLASGCGAAPTCASTSTTSLNFSPHS